MMLSEGRRGIDNVFALKSGRLTMLLDREAYERAGLVGKPHGVKGKRGSKPRWSRFACIHSTCNSSDYPSCRV